MLTWNLEGNEGKHSSICKVYTYTPIVSDKQITFGVDHTTRRRSNINMKCYPE